MASIPVQRILVPTDLSRPQRVLLDYAIGLAKQLQSEVLFFAVIDSPTTLALIKEHPSAGSSIDEGFRAKLAADARVLLKRMVDRAAESGVRASGHAVVSERVGHEVLREAQERDVDLILIAAQEHSRLWTFLFGDSSEEISHLAPCPVLTVKTRNDEDE